VRVEFLLGVDLTCGVEIFFGAASSSTWCGRLLIFSDRPFVVRISFSDGPFIVISIFV
jgi:hypothetical protein